MARNWTSFELSIAVRASMQDIYDAWTRAERVQDWFLEECVYLRNGTLLPASESALTSDTYAWRWFFYPETEYGTILQANGRDFFQFTFAGDCLVDVQLKQTDAYTMVTLRQHNIPTDEASQFNIRIGCTQGWTFYLANLKSVCENGYDLRNKTHPDLLGVNN